MYSRNLCFGGRAAGVVPGSAPPPPRPVGGKGRPTVVIVARDVEEAVAAGDRVFIMLPRRRDRQGAGFDSAGRRVLTALEGALSRPEGNPREAAAGAALLW